MPVGETIIALMLIVGSILMIAEAIIPGAEFIVVGVTLFLTGLIAWILPTVTIPLLLVISLAIGILSLYTYRNLSIYGEEIGKTTGSSEIEYKEGVCLEKITETEGKVKIDDSTVMNPRFQARTPSGEIEEGEKIIVTDAGGGSVLEVVPVSRTQSRNTNDKDTETQKN